MRINRNAVFSSDEEMMLMIYFHSNRAGTIASLERMCGELTEEEIELHKMANVLIGKLQGISDADFLRLPPVQAVLS